MILMFILQMSGIMILPYLMPNPKTELESAFKYLIEVVPVSIFSIFRLSDIKIHFEKCMSRNACVFHFTRTACRVNFDTQTLRPAQDLNTVNP